MSWTIAKDTDSYGEDIDIYTRGLPRPCKRPGYRGKLPKKIVLKLVVDNSKKGKQNDTQKD